MNLSFHLVAGMALCRLATAAQPDSTLWHDEPQPRFARSDLGSVFSGTINLRDADRPTLYKALAIRVGQSENGSGATILYDTELLRAGGAIPDRFVMFNTFRDGLGGSGHWVGPPYLFTTRREPGWSHDDSFDDPRSAPHGPLPRDRAHYRALYRHGPRAVLNYTVGTMTVLESPWLESKPGVAALTRTFELGPSRDSWAVKLLDDARAKPETAVEQGQGRRWMTIGDGDRVTLVGVVDSGRVQGTVQLAATATGQVVARIPAREGPLRFKVLIWSGPREGKGAWEALMAGSPEPEPLQPLTRPGPRQWTASIVTEGRLGGGNGPYVVDTITPPYDNPYGALMTFGGHDFFGNGDAAVCTIHGDVWRVTGLDDGLKTLTWHRYATGLFQPLGLRIVDDLVYVLGRDQITRLRDVNGDFEADVYENFNNDCAIGDNVHEYATSLETDPAGNFYYNKGNNGGQTRHDGSLIRVSADGTAFEVYATGFRWPNGGGAGPDGTITVADQQGEWVPASRLDTIERGGFYGYMPAHHRASAPETYDGPLCWIPHGVDNSSGGQAWVLGNRWGPPDGTMVHLSYGRCRAFLVLEETVDGARQAGLAELDAQFDSGAMRARFRPADGQLYVSGLKGWQTSAAKDGCFQRVRYTGQPLGLPVGLNVHANGIRVTFAEPVDRARLGDPDNWSIEQWNYRWTKEYGSKEYKVSDPRRTGHDSMIVQGVRASGDGRTAFLEVAGLAPVMQMKIQYNFGNAAGRRLRGEIHNTIHRLGPVWSQ